MEGKICSEQMPHDGDYSPLHAETRSALEQNSKCDTAEPLAGRETNKKHTSISTFTDITNSFVVKPHHLFYYWLQNTSQEKKKETTQTAIFAEP